MIDLVREEETGDAPHDGNNNNDDDDDDDDDDIESNVDASPDDVDVDEDNLEVEMGECICLLYSRVGKQCVLCW